MFQRILDQPRLHLPLIFVLCLFLYFPFLGARDFWGVENQYAEVTRVMLLDGEGVLPTLNGTLWPDNPPLFFWLTGFFSWLAGQANEWTVRLPSALSATGLILVFYHFARKRFAPRLGFLSAVALATSLLTIHVERHIPINMVFYFLVSLAMFLFMEVLVFDSTRLSPIYGAWFFIGLACLTKGPIALLLPITVICLYVTFSRQWKKILLLRPFTGALVFLGITVPWFAVASWHMSGDWLGAMFGRHSHVGPGHQPLYDYVVSLPGSLLYSAWNFPSHFMPWSFLSVPAMICLWPDSGKLREGAVQFLFLWFLSVLLFPHLSVEGHSHYNFLAFPPAAFAMGVYLDRLVSSTPGDSARMWTFRFVRGCAIFIAIMSLTLPIIAAFWWSELAWQNATVGVVGLAGAFWLLYAVKAHDYTAIVYGFAVLMVILNLAIQCLVLPAANSVQVRPFAERIGAIIKPGDQVAIYRDRPHHHFNFYSRIRRFEYLGAGKDEVVKFLSGSGPRFILVKKDSLHELKESWRGNLNVVAEQPTVGPRRWLRFSGGWLLLSACNVGCESLPLPSRSKSKVSASAGDGSG